MPNEPDSIDLWEKKRSISELFHLHRLSEPLILITILSVCFYILSYGYYQGFFERLSLPFIGLDLPLTFYLSIGFGATGIIVIGIIYIYFIYLLLNGRNKEEISPRDKKEFYKILIISIIFISVAVISRSILIHCSEFSTEFFAIICRFIDVMIYSFVWVVLITATILIIFRNPKFAIDLETIKGMVILFSPIFVILILFAITYVLGFASAGNLIEGNTGCLSIQFDYKNNNNTTSKDPLILVLYHNERYYAVEKNTPAPLRATLHIISDRDVKSVTIQAIENDKNLSQNLATLQNDLKYILRHKVELVRP